MQIASHRGCAGCDHTRGLVPAATGAVRPTLGTATCSRVSSEVLRSWTVSRTGRRGGTPRVPRALATPPPAGAGEAAQASACRRDPGARKAARTRGKATLLRLLLPLNDKV